MPRKPKYLEAEAGNRERWLVSYTDIVTILLILFVAIAAQSFRQRLPRGQDAVLQPQPAQVQQPALPQPPESRRTLLQAQQKLQQQGLDLKLEKRGLVISLPQAILFPSGEDRVMPSALPLISQIAEVLGGIPNKVALVGHADSMPIHNQRFQNNWELSAARSLRLLELLSSRYGIAESRLSVESYGSYSPKDSNDTAEGRAENRRVEILILDEPAS